MQRSKRTNKTTHRSEGRSALKKDLTGPTLLEMSGFPTYHPLGAGEGIREIDSQFLSPIERGL
jgi:hypothetical protein